MALSRAWLRAGPFSFSRRVEMHGGVDVVINNAGIMQQSPLERLRVDEWTR
jgi:NADP-dependent 3-hydroxy acid dehydrogenase YdfG